MTNVTEDENMADCGCVDHCTAHSEAGDMDEEEGERRKEEGGGRQQEKFADNSIVYPDIVLEVNMESK